jgi:hypothetical protein
MSSCRDAALAYALRGWAVFPIAANKKTPLTKRGFKDATTDPHTIATLFATRCNLAIATGHGLCVLDIDVRNDKGGEATLQEWESHHAPLPRTYTVKTWSGGAHYYFRCPAKTPSRIALGPGIDVRADGGYVLAPPSVIETHPYQVADDVPVVELPTWLHEKIVTATPRVFQLAFNAQGQIPRGQQDDQLHKLACSLTAKGMPVPLVRAALHTALTACPQDPAAPFTESDVDRWMAGAVKFSACPAPWLSYDLAVTKSGKVVCNADAALRVLEQHPDFAETIWFDTFRHRAMTCWRRPAHPWGDADTQTLLVFLQREIHLSTLSKSAVEDALGVFVAQHPRHEVQDWIATLTWDTTPRIASCLSQLFGAPATPYIAAASRNFWLSLMARVYRPGCQMDHMLVLEGPQGQGKTSALRILGGPWYLSMSESVMQKDFFQALPGHLIVEIAELDSFHRAELTRIKQVISTASDSFRPAYGRHTQTAARQCLFVGTTNEEHYLRDMTGGRRFWPVPCGQIDCPALLAQREQLFAEAAETFRRGVTWWEMPGEAAQEQEARREADAWEAPIHEFLLLKEDVSLTELLTEAVQVPLGQIDVRHQRRVGAILRKLGWTAMTIRRGEAVLRRWHAPVREAGEDLNTSDFYV